MCYDSPWYSVNMFVPCAGTKQPTTHTNKQTNKLKRCEPNVTLGVMTSSHRATHSKRGGVSCTLMFV